MSRASQLFEHLIIARWCLHGAHLDMAADEYARVRAMAAARRDPDTEAAALTGLADVAIQLGQWDSARLLLESALAPPACDRVQPRRLLRARYLLGLALMALGRAAASRAALEAAMAVVGAADATDSARDEICAALSQLDLAGDVPDGSQLAAAALKFDSTGLDVDGEDRRKFGVAARSVDLDQLAPVRVRLDGVSNAGIGEVQHPAPAVRLVVQGGPALPPVGAAESALGLPPDARQLGEAVAGADVAEAQEAGPPEPPAVRRHQRLAEEAFLPRQKIVSRIRVARAAADPVGVVGQKLAAVGQQPASPVGASLHQQVGRSDPQAAAGHRADNRAQQL
uniref:TPR_REGION domain-containing protein n=1 Tax=Macrostomum lignano TaxID=282301 RepID=A0A1I8IDI4_9PLAT